MWGARFGIQLDMLSIEELKRTVELYETLDKNGWKCRFERRTALLAKHPDAKTQGDVSNLLRKAGITYGCWPEEILTDW